MMRWTLRSLCLLLLVLAPAGCGPKKGGQPPAEGPRAGDPNAENPDREAWVDLAEVPYDASRTGGRLVVARGQLPRSLNPLYMGSRDAKVLGRQLHCPSLLQLDPQTGEAMPWAASKAPTLSADGKRALFEIREGLRWEDGTPLEAAHFAAMVAAARSEERKAGRRRRELASIAEATAEGPLRLALSFREPIVSADPIGLALQALPSHALPPAEVFRGERAPQGYGPYRVASWSDAGVVLELREAYRAAAHPIRPFHVQEIEWRLVTDEAARDRMVARGEVHFAGLSPPEMERARADEGLAAKAWSGYAFLPTYYFVGWNQCSPRDLQKPHPALADARVRRALGMTYPRAQLAALYGELGRPCSGPWWMGDPGSDPTVAPSPEDLAAAGLLLDEAGWKLGEDGRRRRDGQPLDLLVVHAASDSFTRIMEPWRENAARCGVILRSEACAQDTWAKRYMSRQWDALLAIWSLDNPVDEDLHSQWHGEAKGTPTNVIAWSHARTDRLCEALRSERDPQRRIALRRELHRFVAEEQPYLFLWHSATGYLVSRSWANVRIHPLGPRFWDLVERERWRR